jgi:hypothetical protein
MTKEEHVDPFREALTRDQRDVYDQVRYDGAQDGRDLADVMAGMDMPADTRTAVADALGGPGVAASAQADREAYERGEYVPVAQRVDEIEA